MSVCYPKHHRTQKKKSLVHKNRALYCARYCVMAEEWVAKLREQFKSDVQAMAKLHVETLRLDMVTLKIKLSEEVVRKKYARLNQSPSMGMRCV